MTVRSHVFIIMVAFEFGFIWLYEYYLSNSIGKYMIKHHRYTVRANTISEGVGLASWSCLSSLSVKEGRRAREHTSRRA